jgi:hypothetical protein
MKPVEVRSQLVEALRLDLVGPENGTDLEAEVLTQAPSRWYLTGFLVPLEAGEDQKSDETGQDELNFGGGDANATDDDTTPEPAAMRRAYFPSSIGLSLLVPRDTGQIRVIAHWGDYGALAHESAETSDNIPSGDEAHRSASNWKRTPRHAELTLSLPAETAKAVEHEIPESEGLRLALSVRPVQSLGIAEGLVPGGTRSVSLFLVNHREPMLTDELRDQRFIFQAGLTVHAVDPLVPRPNLRGQVTDDWDERVADLQYRDVYEFAVGHGIATRAEIGDNGVCHTIHTCWVPSADVERVAPAQFSNVELRMETLAELADGPAVSQALGAFVAQYRTWIEAQSRVLPALTPRRREIAQAMLQRAGKAGRTDAG